MTTEPQLKVGDELAFRASYGTHWEIHRVEKITPSGRINCGRYTLNPNLSIRGRRGFGYGGPYRGEMVTDKIRKDIQRANNVSKLRMVKWDELDDDTLKAVAELLDKAKE